MKSHFSTSLIEGVKSSGKWAPPLVLLGDGLEYGLNTYYHMPDKNFNHPTDFAVDVSLDIPKAAVSGTVGTVTGVVVSTVTAGGVSVIGSAVASAGIGAAAGPIGVAVGFAAGLYAGWQASNVIEHQYTKYHLREDIKSNARHWWSR